MNPLLLAKAAPYAIAAMIAFAFAWGIQSIRLTHAEQEFTAYRQEQTRIYQEAQHAADLQRDEASAKYASQGKQLEASILAGDVYRRCVAAGRCGRVQQQSTCTASDALSASPRTDDPSPDTVPAPTGDAALNDCAMTTLQLNSLQADIEAQPGYAQ